jgi:hypothetical protein
MMRSRDCAPNQLDGICECVDARKHPLTCILSKRRLLRSHRFYLLDNRYE